MGFASASREEKLKMSKTNKTRKITKKLGRLRKRGKISREIIDGLKSIKASKSRDSRQRVRNIEDDWVSDRAHQFNEDAEDNLPLDMLDADIDWENSAFASMSHRLGPGNREIENDMEVDDDLEVKPRKFEGQLEVNREEMLPIKLQDGRLLRPTREKEQEDEREPEEEEEMSADKEDFSQLSAMELLAKRKALIEEFKEQISTMANSLLSNPQENIYSLRDLFHLCQGLKVHTLVRETVQKLATASMLQVLVDIIPGYAIRPLTEVEQQQQVKKETKKLQTFEESLLRYYLKFLQMCEKATEKFGKKERKLPVKSFSYKFGLLCVKAISRLLTSSPHFNYSTNIVSTLVKLSLCSYKEVMETCCTALNKLFDEDLHLKMTLFGARSISSIVTKVKGMVPPLLIGTFLHMNIREVKNEDKKSKKGGVFFKRQRLKRERENKSAAKYKKQLKKLQADLEEIDAAESLSTKLKHATEAMKYVFQCYFSILKRMPNLQLLEPVLEGLSKYAHLLNVEFFEDIVLTMEELIDKQHLRLLDQFHCVNTVFVILSGEGQLLNVDPSRFYRSVYRLLNSLPFEKRSEQRRRQMVVVTRTLELMISERRKQVPLARVASFVKRLLSVATVMDDPSALCILSLVRSFFIAHPKLLPLVEEDESEGGAGGAFRPDIDDPDVANATGSNVILELRMLTKRRHLLLSQFARNILQGVPSTGHMQLSPQVTNMKAWALMETDTVASEYRVDMKYVEEIQKICKSLKKPEELSPKNLQSQISRWLHSKELSK